MHVTGYYIETTNLKNIEMVLDEMRAAAKKSAEKVFHKQLSSEIENLIDSITVGTTQRPIVENLYEQGLGEMREKLFTAEKRGADTCYNYGISANILLLENKTYFKVNSSNDFFLKEFNKIHSLKPFPFGEDWKELMDKYEKTPLMWIQLFSWNNIEPNPKYLKFSSKIDRAERLARHNITNHILSQHACGKEIPPQKLMEYVDLAMSELINNSFYKEELNKQKANALTFLADITDELLFGKPASAEEKTNEEVQETVNETTEQ